MYSLLFVALALVSQMPAPPQPPAEKEKLNAEQVFLLNEYDKAVADRIAIMQLRSQLLGDYQAVQEQIATWQETNLASDDQDLVKLYLSIVEAPSNELRRRQIATAGLNGIIRRAGAFTKQVGDLKKQLAPVSKENTLAFRAAQLIGQSTQLAATFVELNKSLEKFSPTRAAVAKGLQGEMLEVAREMQWLLDLPIDAIKVDMDTLVASGAALESRAPELTKLPALNAQLVKIQQLLESDVVKLVASTQTNRRKLLERAASFSIGESDTADVVEKLFQEISDLAKAVRDDAGFLQTNITNLKLATLQDAVDELEAEVKASAASGNANAAKQLVAAAKKTLADMQAKFPEEDLAKLNQLKGDPLWVWNVPGGPVTKETLKANQEEVKKKLLSAEALLAAANQGDDLRPNALAEVDQIETLLRQLDALLRSENGKDKALEAIVGIFRMYPELRPIASRGLFDAGAIDRLMELRPEGDLAFKKNVLDMLFTAKKLDLVERILLDTQDDADLRLEAAKGLRKLAHDVKSAGKPADIQALSKRLRKLLATKELTHCETNLLAELEAGVAVLNEAILSAEFVSPAASSMK